MARDREWIFCLLSDYFSTSTILLLPLSTSRLIESSYLFIIFCFWREDNCMSVILKKMIFIPVMSTGRHVYNLITAVAIMSREILVCLFSNWRKALYSDSGVFCVLYKCLPNLLPTPPPPPTHLAFLPLQFCELRSL